MSGAELARSDPGAASVHAFLAALASGSPTPGGGAAAALGGAVGAALVGMVCRVTAARDRSAGRDGSPTVDAADQLRRRLEALMGEDMDAYRGVLRARAKDPGAGTVEDAMVRATEVPLALARASREVLAMCEAVATRARASTLSDLGVATALAWGALAAAALTVRANLGELTDATVVRTAAAELQALLADGDGMRQRASGTIARRMDGPGA